MNKEPGLDAEKIAKAISLRGLIDGFEEYWNTALLVFKHPWRYAGLYIKPYPNYSLAKSLLLGLYGVALCFVLYVPVIYKYGLHVVNLHFLLQQMYNATFFIIVAHVSAQFCGGQGTIRQSIATYCIWIGTIWPIGWMAAYPLLYYSRLVDFIYQPEMAPNEEVIPQVVAIWSIFCMLPLLIFGAVIGIIWMARVHSIALWKMALSWLVVYVPAYTLHSRYVAPIASKIINAVAEMLGIIVG